MPGCRVTSLHVSLLTIGSLIGHCHHFMLKLTYSFHTYDDNGIYLCHGVGMLLNFPQNISAQCVGCRVRNFPTAHARKSFSSGRSFTFYFRFCELYSICWLFGVMNIYLVVALLINIFNNVLITVCIRRNKNRDPPATRHRQSVTRDCRSMTITATNACGRSTAQFPMWCHIGYQLTCDQQCEQRDY